MLTLDIDIFTNRLQICLKRSIRWFAQRPALTLIFIIIISVALLPAVTVTILTPIALLFSYIGIATTPGGITTIYGILFKGFLLALFVIGLLVIGFLVITCASVMHTYKILPGLSFKKN